MGARARRGKHECFIRRLRHLGFTSGTAADGSYLFSGFQVFWRRSSQKLGFFALVTGPIFGGLLAAATLILSDVHPLDRVWTVQMWVTE